MTVQDLIILLQQIENKSKIIYVYDQYGDMDKEVAISEEEIDKEDSVLIY